MKSSTLARSLENILGYASYSLQYSRRLLSSALELIMTFNSVTTFHSADSFT